MYGPNMDMVRLKVNFIYVYIYIDLHQAEYEHALYLMELPKLVSIDHLWPPMLEVGWFKNLHRAS